jgi:DNA adenine methylase
MSKLKTPISYYGGKQSMARLIVSLIPKHITYVEPFCGGAAVLFAKEPSKMECINDMNGHVINFYKVLKSDFPILRLMILETPSSRQIHREAEFILKNPEYFSDIRKAWAFWVQTNMSFSSIMFGGYGYGKSSPSTTKKIHNKKIQFNKALKHRFELVDIESNDAIKVIQSRDTEDTFHYVDPPYFNSDCGHYKGYTEADFVKLLECLSKLKGKFLLSTYPSEPLKKYTEENNWKTHSITKAIVACKGDRSKTKTEVLTANYDFITLLN